MTRLPTNTHTPTATRTRAPTDAPATWGKRLWAADGAAGEAFGAVVALSGDIMVVGAADAGVDGAAERGAAYLFRRNRGAPDNWGLIKKLTAGDGEAYDHFGSSVAIYGTTVVVGAPDADGAQANQGVFYVFERDAGGAGVWGQVREVRAGDGAGGDAFGQSLAISGNTIIVGAPYADVSGVADQGAAYLFGRDAGGAGQWGQIKKLVAGNGAQMDNFGSSAALDGALVVVGAAHVDLNGWDNAGAAYLFGRDVGGANQWGLVKKLSAGDPGNDADFGGAVAVSANTVVAGAAGANVNGKIGPGALYVYGKDAGGANRWSLVKKLVASDAQAGDGLGQSVSISGASIVAGAPGADSAGRADQGAAYVFARDAGGPESWGQFTRLTADDGAAHDAFGASVALDGATIAVGAPGARTNYAGQGAAYAFTPYALRVNSAGPKYTDTAGYLWLADRAWPPGAPITPGMWGYVGGAGRVVSAPISNTEDDKLYQSERLYTGAVRPGYKFIVPDGRYMLTFKYAETNWGVSGKRKFTVLAESQICFANYDIFMAAGAKNKAAPDKVCYVTVSDGVLDVDFISVAGQAKANAITIQQLFQ